MVYHTVEPYPKTWLNHDIFGMVQPYGQPWSTVVDHTVLPWFTLPYG